MPRRASEKSVIEMTSTDGAIPIGKSLGASLAQTEVARLLKLMSSTNAQSAVLDAHIEASRFELPASCALYEEISSVEGGGQPGQP